MWKAAVGHNVTVAETESDDWETDPDFVNDISEEEQRWGAKTIEGSGRPQHINIRELRSNVSKEHEILKKKELQDGPRASYGYGGQFGTEKDRMDKSALGHDYRAEVEKHSSQTDAAKGFGGKYGVQKDRTDKSAVGFGYKAELQQHSSQKDYATGFGGRYGVQTDRVDKSSVGFDYKAQLQQHSSQQDYSKGFGGKFGVQKDCQDKSAHTWSHKEEIQPHQSQTDYSQGFGGKFGVQKDRQDKSAHSWSYKEEIKPHESQTDYAKGFGGRYGVQTDRVDKCASGFSEIESPSSAYEKTQPLEALTSGTHDLRSRFENMAKTAEEENHQRAEEEKIRRQKREKEERGQITREIPQKRDRDNELSQKLPVQPPAPLPRSSAPLQPSKKEDTVYEEPPCVPPKHPGFGVEFNVPSPHMDHEEDMYEDIPVPLLDIVEDYEPIPDLPPRREDDYDDEDDYECVLEPPVPTEDNLYEGLAKKDDNHGMAPPCPMGETQTSGICAVAIYDYEGGGDDEISFDPQDLITDIEMLDEGWWIGTCRGCRGLFPANYVELVDK
ncbi:src substrate cortactin-like isoform X2 [Spea bombifrons]|uniref:src substrate cortactin-like isoform X2 n=1 Tax=Spea bombifrons TaxID=233779 RepID=UPI002349FA19|nr:src substrate cortactin-like isoform X2 [Spea bombifrons]